MTNEGEIIATQCKKSRKVLGLHHFTSRVFMILNIGPRHMGHGKPSYVSRKLFRIDCQHIEEIWVSTKVVDGKLTWINQPISNHHYRTMISSAEIRHSKRTLFFCNLPTEKRVVYWINRVEIPFKSRWGEYCTVVSHAAVEA